MNKLYHIKKEIATGAAEFAGLLALISEVLIFWEVAAAIMHNTPIHAWCAALAAVLILSGVCAAAIAAARCLHRRPVRRYGVIGADAICKIMRGDSK